MNAAKTIYNPNETALGNAAARWFLEQARAIAKTKPEVLVALPGGRSVAGLYKALAKSRDLVWKHIHIFLLDERAVPISSPESNYRLIHESFANELVNAGILPTQNLHPLIVDEKAPDYGAAQYELIITKHGDAFDIVVFGSGEDGHVAALFPHHTAIHSPNVDQALDNSPKAPPRRITSTPKVLAHMRAALILFIGPAKAGAYRRFRDPHLTITDCPAKIALEAHDVLIATTIPNAISGTTSGVA